MYIYTCRKYVEECTHICVYIYTHTYVHTYILTYIHAKDICKYIYIYANRDKAMDSHIIWPCIYFAISLLSNTQQGADDARRGIDKHADCALRFMVQGFGQGVVWDFGDGVCV